MSALRIALAAVVVALAAVAAGLWTASPDRTPPTAPAAAAGEPAGETDGGAEDEEHRAVPVSPAAPDAIGDPIVGTVRRSGISRSVMRLPEPAPVAALAPLEAEPGLPLAADAPIAPAAAGDTVQTVAPAAQAPAPNGPVIAGLTGSVSGRMPADTNIDVGPDHVVEAVNVAVAVYDKDTRSELARFTFDQLFDGTGTPCDDSNVTDPIVLYDGFRDRWILQDLAYVEGADPSNPTPGPYYHCFAVSRTPDPTGRWWLYAVRNPQLQIGPGTFIEPFPDYPKLGVWPTGLFMSTAEYMDFGTNHSVYLDPRVWALDLDAMASGGEIDYAIFDLPRDYFVVLPSNAKPQTGTPPAGRPNLFATIWGDPVISVWEFAVDWANPEAATFSENPVEIPVEDYLLPPWDVPSSASNVDTAAGRLMMQNRYTSIEGAESLWLSHEAGSGPSRAGPARVRWYELSVTDGRIATTPRQQSTWAPDAVNRFVPSLAVNRIGDMAIGYSVSDATMHPGIRYAGRLAGDPLSTLTLGERTLADGAQSPPAPFSRWGDYAAMTLDPDGCTFWLASEAYLDPSNVIGWNWGTAIGSFVYPGCTQPPSALTAPVASGTAVVGQQLACTQGTWSGVPTAYAYQWQRDVGSGFADIASATGTTRALTDDDGGAAVRCVVRATSPYGTTPQASAALRVTPVQTTGATIARFGTELRQTVRSTWQTGGQSGTRTLQWVRGPLPGTPIAGATRTTYVPTTADLRAQLHLRTTMTVDGVAGVGYSNAIVMRRLIPWEVERLKVDAPSRTVLLRRGLAVAVTSPVAGTMTVTARSGSRVIGRRTATVRPGAQRIVVPVGARWARDAAPGASIVVTTAGRASNGARYVPASAATRLR